MVLMPATKCPKCHRKLTAEGRLLAAIFSEDATLCHECYVVGMLPKCHDCGEPTSLSLNDIPLCVEHIGG